MAERFDLLVKGGIAVTPMGTAEADIGISGGKVAAIGALGGASAATVIEARGLHVLPGLIDAHLHFREPGAEHIETIATGTEGAALGGLACVFDMPNTNPVIGSIETLDWKRTYIQGRAWVDMGLYVGAVKENIDSLAELEIQPNVCAIKVFAGSSTGTMLIEDDAGLEAVMRQGFRRVCYHSEDEYRLRERMAMAEFKSGHYSKHAELRDVETAVRCTKRLAALARKTGRRAHILHVSTAEELDFLKDWRDLITVEVLLNHLTQVAPECYELGGFGVMNPPIRDRRHYEAAWAAVRDGTVDVVGSDHAPHARADKLKPWPQCPAGLAGVQTIVPLMLDHVNAGRLSLERLVDLMCAGPARVYGLVGKGRLAAGYDGDLTIVDMKKRFTITNSWIRSPCGWTPFDGTTVSALPVATVVRGQVVMRDNALQGAPVGRPARFAETLREAAARNLL